MTKKPEAENSVEEVLLQALVPKEEQPYKVPENWLWVRLGSFIELATDFVANGSFASLKDNVKYYKSENYALMVKTQDFANAFTQSLTYTDQKGYDFLAKSVLTGGELILSNIGSIGKVFRVPFFGRPMTLAPNSIMLKCHDEHDYEYLYYYFLSPIGNEMLLSISSGTAIVKFNKTDLKTVALPLPPLSEQQRIVSAIESLFAKLDRAKELLEDVQEAFEEQKATILARAFRGELTDGWREERGLKFEKEWEKEPLENLCDSVSDGDHQPPPQTEEGIPFLVISNIASGEIDFSDTRFVSTNYYKSLSDKRRPQIGDILFSVTGSFGIPAMVKDDSPFCFQRHIALIRPNRIDNTYLYYFLQDPEVYQEISSIATGVAQLTVPIRGLRQISVPVPPKEEQQEIVRILDNLLDQSSAAASLCDQMEQIDQLKKTILAKAFRGELDTNEPAEESAEKLLREVLRQRAAVGAGKAKAKRKG